MQNSCQLWCIAFGIITVDTRVGLVLGLGWASCWDRGRGFACVYYCSSHLCSQEGKFRLKTRKKNIIYALANHLFYLVFPQGRHYSHKYGCL